MPPPRVPVDRPRGTARRLRAVTVRVTSSRTRGVTTEPPATRTRRSTGAQRRRRALDLVITGLRAVVMAVTAAMAAKALVAVAVVVVVR